MFTANICREDKVEDTFQRIQKKWIYYVLRRIEKKYPSDTVNRNQRANLDPIFMAEDKFDLPLERLIDGIYVCMVITYVVFVVVSHIQRIGCQPEKTTLHGGQSRSWSAEQGKENKRKKSGSIPPPPTPHTARSEKIN